MNIIAVDDEALALKSISRSIKKALPEYVLHCFDMPSKAIAFAKTNQVDVAFLDIEMGGKNGLVLAKELKDIYAKTNIVFVTGYSEYAIDAFSLAASGYLLKPVNADMILQAMENLRNPVKLQSQKRIQIQTFGNFEIFADRTPLNFSLQKTKELLAYLVSRRGAWCSVREAAAILWEDKPDSEKLQSHLRTLVADLSQTLERVNASGLLLKKRGMLAVDKDQFDCDIYRLFQGDIIAINEYAGEFMAQYSWAEFMNVYLENMK